MRGKRQILELQLSDEQQNMLIALADADEARWSTIGHAVQLWLDDAELASAGKRVNRGKFYARVGAVAGLAANTVRQYQRVAEATEIGRLEFPQFRYNHWLCFLAQAKREGRDVEMVATDWAATADEYGGLPVPVDVVRAALRAKGADKPVDVAALIERAARAVQAALDHSDNAELSNSLEIALAELGRAAGIVIDPGGDDDD